MELLFDKIDRNEIRPKRQNEPLFEYYNSSARNEIEGIRNLLDKWFEKFPNSGKNDLKGRFRSRTDSQHEGAFFELYLHELLTSHGYECEIHPTVSDEIPTHPDFLVKKDGERFFFLEAVLALPSKNKTSEEARIAQVYDTLNRLKSPNFFLGIRLRGAPETSPPGARLRKLLERWLEGLNPDSVAEIAIDGDFDSLPHFDWSHEGWDVTFLAIPKKPEKRGRPEARPIGITMPEAKIVESYKAIRSAVASKSTKYGELDIPFVVAVNVLDEFADQEEAINGLLGQTNITIARLPDGTERTTPGRNPNGAWFGPRGPQNTRISAVLMAIRLSPWGIGRLTPDLIHHPWAQNPISPDHWKLHQLIPNMDNNQLERRNGESAPDCIGIPSTWPFSV